MPLPWGSGDTSFTATLLHHKIQYATRKAINAKPRCALMRLRENSAKNTLNRLPSSTLLKPRASGSGLQSKAQRGRCTPTFRDALLAEKEVAGSRISSGCTFQAFQQRERELAICFPVTLLFLQLFVRLNYRIYLIFGTSNFKEICTRGVKITFRFGTPPTGVMLGGPKLLGPPPQLLSPPPPLPPPPPPPPSPPAPDERLQRLRVSTSADLKKKCWYDHHQLANHKY